MTGAESNIQTRNAVKIEQIKRCKGFDRKTVTLDFIRVSSFI
jgi:hypothetical protein